MIRKIALSVITVLLAIAGWTVYRVLRGDPLPVAGPMPSDARGILYFVDPDKENGGFAVWEQPANVSASPNRKIRMAGCPKVWCELYWMDVIGGEVHYIVFDKEFYLWRGDKAEKLPKGPGPEIGQLPAGVEVRNGTIYVHGKPVLAFEGTSNAMSNAGYFPRALSPDGRYLAFSYSGYASRNRLFLAHLLGVEKGKSGNYALDQETKAIYPLPEGTHLRWK